MGTPQCAIEDCTKPVRNLWGHNPYVGRRMKSGKKATRWLRLGFDTVCSDHIRDAPVRTEAEWDQLDYAARASFRERFLPEATLGETARDEHRWRQSKATRQGPLTVLEILDETG